MKANNIIQKRMELYNILGIFFLYKLDVKNLSKKDKQGGRGKGITKGISRRMHTCKTLKHWFHYYESKKRKKWWYLWSVIYKFNIKTNKILICDELAGTFVEFWTSVHLKKNFQISSYFCWVLNFCSLEKELPNISVSHLLN